MKRHKIIFLIGLILISAIYTFYNVFLVDIYYYRSMPIWIKFGNKAIIILLVYAIGFYVLKRITVLWMLNIWHIVFICATTGLVTIAFFQWKFQIVSEELKNIVHTLMDLLLSPVLYLCLGFIQYRISMAK
jgi:hypothetical protein